MKFTYNNQTFSLTFDYNTKKRSTTARIWNASAEPWQLVSSATVSRFHKDNVDKPLGRRLALQTALQFDPEAPVQLLADKAFRSAVWATYFAHASDLRREHHRLLRKIRNMKAAFAVALDADSTKLRTLARVRDLAQQYVNADPQVRGECYRELCDSLTSAAN